MQFRLQFLLLKTKFANRMQTGKTRMKAMKQEIPTPASIRKTYVEEYLKRRPDAEEFARFTESELADFIRKHESPNFQSIYTHRP